MSDKIDVGLGYNYRVFTERGTEGVTGLIVEGPAGERCLHHADGRCAGGLHFSNSNIAAKEGRPMWTVVSLEPMTITPSIRCSCDTKFSGQGQHGYITNGRWVNAGGIVT